MAVQIGQALALSRAFTQLAVSESRYRILVENAGEGICTLDSAGLIRDTNPEMRRILQRSAQELVGVPIQTLIAEDDRARSVGQLAEILREGHGQIEGRRYLRPDGTIATCDVSATLVDFEGAPMVIGVVRDVSERMEAILAEQRSKEALRLSEVRFARLEDSGLIGILVADVYGTIHEANDTFLKMLGFTREELDNGAMKWSELTPPEYAELDQEALGKFRANALVEPWEKEFFRKDGSRVCVIIGAAMLDFPNSIAFTSDITARKVTEGALKRSQEQVRQAQKMEAVGRLAGGIAHDFNNLLSVVLCYSEMMLGELEPGDPMRGDVTEIRKAGEQAAGLTRQLLLFSRQQVLEPKVLDLNKCLKDMENMLRRLLGADVNVNLVHTPGLGRIRIDPGSLEQVIMNLVVNARDAMPVGGRLTLETANVELDDDFVADKADFQAGSYVMLAVSDSGMGMSRETQARIFEPFYTTKEVGRGTGLGLSTVFGIIQVSGGGIIVYSEPEHGTTFKIYLPRVQAEISRPGESLAPAQLEGTETLLLVEDEAAVRLVAANILRKRGYTVLEAGDGAQAISICQDHPETIHLLLSDVVMPAMSGPELLRRVSQLRPEMESIFMSGYTDDTIFRHGILEGRVAYLQKPITPDSLSRKVREILDAL